MITSLIVHNGLIYISGQGANDAGNVQGADIESHTKEGDGQRQKTCGGRRRHHGHHLAVDGVPRQSRLL